MNRIFRKGDLSIRLDHVDLVVPRVKAGPSDYSHVTDSLSVMTNGGHVYHVNNGDVDEFLKLWNEYCDNLSCLPKS